MEVLTKILQQGTEFETLAETVLADRFERLVELVTMIGDKGELPIAMALASVVANPHMVLLLLLYCGCIHNQISDRSDQSERNALHSQSNLDLLGYI